MDSLLDHEYRLEDLLPLIQEQLNAGKHVKFAPRGTSMLPMLRQGIDSVLLSPAPGRLKKYDLPLYRRDNSQFVLHRVVEVSETYTCIGDNQFVYEPGIRHEQVIALVTAFWRGNRMIRVTALPYRIYCTVWHLSRPIRCFYRRSISRIKRNILQRENG